MCIQCKLKEAKWYCQKCVNYFCDECNQLIHYGNNVTENNLKSVFKHENFTKKIDYSTRPGKCSIHPDRDAEYFCEDCKRTICGYCRFKGAHNKGLQSQHLLEDIYESFKKVNQNQNQNAEGIDKKKTTAYSNMRKIADQIRSMDKKMDENENRTQILLNASGESVDVGENREILFSRHYTDGVLEDKGILICRL